MQFAQLLSWVVLALLYLAFWMWYGGQGKPLSQAETKTLLAEMRRRAGKQAGDDAPLLEHFSDLAKSDDGHEFYMVNLLKFRQKAAYPPGSVFGDDPFAANQRYNKAIVPLLLKYGGHPVFLGQVQGRFIHPADVDEWDQVGIVRYRSRRDMFRMAMEMIDNGADIHKWAALEKTQVFPVKPLINIAYVRAMVALLLFGFGIFVYFTASTLFH